MADKAGKIPMKGFGSNRKKQLAAERKNNGFLQNSDAGLRSMQTTYESSRNRGSIEFLTLGIQYWPSFGIERYYSYYVLNSLDSVGLLAINCNVIFVISIQISVWSCL